MTTTVWYEHFKSQAQAGEAGFAKEPPGVSLLAFCIKNKLLTSAEYLAWACEAQQIPVLSDGFFALHKPTAEFFAPFKNQFEWTPELLPVAQWNEVLIVAGLEKPSVMPAGAIFVFASYENLAASWSSVSSSSTATSAAAPKIAPAPAEISVSIAAPTSASAPVPMAVTESKTVSVEPSPEASLEEFVSMDTTPVESETSVPAPENFFNENGELILQADSSSEEEAPILEEGEESPKQDEEISSESEEEVSGVPEGLFGDINQTGPSPNLSINNFVGVKLSPLEATPPPSPVSEEKTAIGIPDPQEAVEETSQPSIRPTTIPPSSMHEEMMNMSAQATRVAAIDTLPSDEDAAENTQSSIRLLGSLVSNGEELPNAPVKMTQAPTIGAAAYFLEKVRKQNQEHFDKEVLASFNQYKTFFKKSMLLAIGDKDRVVKPILWDGGDFDIRSPSMVEFSLKTPSIFRIVSGTQRPYHGYVVANELNDAFFESWNSGQIPDHVTIVPLMDHDLVVGMLMGFGEKTAYNKNVLQFSQNVAKDLSSKIMKPLARAA